MSLSVEIFRHRTQKAEFLLRYNHRLRIPSHVANKSQEALEALIIAAEARDEELQHQ
jgi:hypothetical protein